MCKFDTPLDFDLSLRKEFDAFDDSVWVCNPSGLYITGAQLDGIKVLATPSTGTNHIDLNACKRRGIKVLSLLDDRAGLETISASAEWTFKLILDGLRLKRPYMELQDKWVGLVGYGRIGKKLHKYLAPHETTLLIHDPHEYPGAELGDPFLSCDIVVICCSLTNETRGMVTLEHIASMNQNAVLVNTARGEIVDELGLYDALRLRPDIRYCTDVVHGEVEGRGDQSRRKLRELGALVTDHIAGDTFESRTKAARIILGLLKKEMGDG